MSHHSRSQSAMPNMKSSKKKSAAKKAGDKILVSLRGRCVYSSFSPKSNNNKKSTSQLLLAMYCIQLMSISSAVSTSSMPSPAHTLATSLCNCIRVTLSPPFYCSSISFLFNLFQTIIIVLILFLLFLLFTCICSQQLLTRLTLYFYYYHHDHNHHHHYQPSQTFKLVGKETQVSHSLGIYR